MKKIIYIFCLITFLSGCSYRFAITKKHICTHPDSKIWSCLKINPIHWGTNKIYSKCHLCGQKFLEYYQREQYINKVETVK